MRLTLCLVALPGFAAADAPRVLTDIAPVHALVARVMEGAGTPDLLLPPNASPHDFALRPSDARNLSNADVVIWMGEALTPFLEDPIATLAPEAISLELLDTEGWPKRMFEEGDHDEHAHDHADGHDHDEHAHDHADGHDHDEHAHDHHHEGLDPHAWLDPMAAESWLTDIAETLAAADPENAALYALNAETARAELTDLTAEISARLEGVQGGYIVPHEAYGYFAARFDLPEAGSIASVDAYAPGPAHIRALRQQIAEQGITCVLTDPQTSDDWATLLREGSEVKTARIDPLGGQFAPGAALYPALLRDIADQISSCLK